MTIIKVYMFYSHVNYSVTKINNPINNMYMGFTVT